MIGEPTIDPALGEKRRKALQAALARAAGLGGAGNSQQSQPSYGAVGRGSVSGFGIKPVNRGRPSSILDFLSMRGPGGFARGRAAFQSASGGLGQLISDVQMPSPLPSTGPVGGVQVGGISSGGAPADSPQGVANALNSEDPNKATPASVMPNGSVFEGSLPGYTSASAAGSGLIPLGGGIFLDPDTGQLRGAGV